MYKFDILTQKSFLVEKIETKILYNTLGKKTLSEWTPKGDYTLGNLVSHNNNVNKGVSDVYIVNQKQNSGVKQYGIDNNNFYKVCINFFVRKCIISTWLNQNDEFLEPKSDIDIIKYDSIVYSLFNNSSHQKSLDNYKNEFFWMSKEEMMELANNNNYYVLYSDARTENNRYVHNLLFGEENIYEQLSPDAKLVLDKATELVRMSMTTRSHFADDQNHLNSWDAGYAQLKLVWKEYFPNEFKEFRQLYKNLEDRMRPLVYELGFLLK
jgi:hypothetical protein